METPQTVAALQAKIDALQAQIAAAGKAPAAVVEEYEEEEIVEEYEEEEVSEEGEAPEAAPPAGKKKGFLGRFRNAKTDAPASPTRAAPSSPKAPASPSRALVAPPAPAPEPEASGPPETDPSATVESTVTINEDRYKKNHNWNKPGWAFAVEDQDERAVDDDPINNPNLKQQEHSGYRRQVFAKDLSIDKKGTFVKPQAKAPDPRKTWIVVRLNGDPIPGKIVMHLHGKDVNSLVEKFVALKGSQIYRQGSSILVEGDPKFFITFDAARGLDSKAGVYGVVQEGHSIISKILEAGPDAPVEIKQAHIFPIKKSKTGI
jgi:hypothetical protein